MGAHCELEESEHGCSKSYIRVLWIVLAVNAIMFVGEVAASAFASSVSLLSDSLDFLGDTINYGVSLYAVNKHLTFRAKISLIKAACMLLFSLWIIAGAVIALFQENIPQYEVMGGVGAIALIANLTCAFLLYPHRKGDSNQLSVWLCSRNDAIGNIVVIVAALLVFMTSERWPDTVAAISMAAIIFFAAIKIARKALKELH